MTKCFHKTTETGGSRFVKNLLGSLPVLNIENDDKYCFMRLILAGFQPCFNKLSNRFSNYGQFFDELNTDGFDFSFGFKCSDVDRVEKLNALLVSIIKVHFYASGFKAYDGTQSVHQ